MRRMWVTRCALAMSLLVTLPTISSAQSLGGSMTPSDSMANQKTAPVISFSSCFDGTNWLRQQRVSDTDAIGVAGNNCRVAAMQYNFNGTSYDRVRGAANGLNSAGTGLNAAQIVGQYDDTSPTAITENNFGNIRMSANRNLYGTIRDAAGNERGANVNANNELTVALPSQTGTTNPVAAASAVTVRTPIACPLYTNISTTADAVLISGTASQRIKICSIVLVANAAETVSIWEGTGTACGTSSVALYGSSTESNGMSISANGGFSAVAAFPFIQTATDANDLCIRLVGANRVTGGISYVKAAN